MPQQQPPRHIGHCIYCRSTEELSDEHVIPYSLGGRIILNKASCADCARITSDFERKLARDLLGPVRAKEGAPSRTKRKSRPTHFPHTGIYDGKISQRILPLNEHPGTFVLPVFTPATILHPPTILRLDPVTHWFTGSEASYEDLTPIYGQNYRLPDDMILNVVRLVAKIGLGYAIFLDGEGGFEDQITPLILGQTTAFRPQIGGSKSRIREPQRPYVTAQLFKVGRAGVEYQCCEVGLFTQIGGPFYDVVLGPLRK